MAGQRGKLAVGQIDDRRERRGLRRTLRLPAESGTHAASARRGWRARGRPVRSRRSERADARSVRRRASSQRRCPKASTGSPTRPRTPISPRSASCSRSIATTASRPTRRRSPASSRPTAVDAIRIQRIAEAIAYGRDLVNAPANVLGPDALEQEAVKLAEHFDASVAMVRGDELIAANFPLIHAVGRAGAEEPRIVDFSWGREDAPKVAIIGKGVTFDTGGLDIKPASGMELMKKDMGGAATALTLARLIMEAGLDLRLRTRDPDRRERDRGAGDAAGRRDRQPQGDFGRGRQHRRRRADDPCRRARARRRGRAGADARLRHPDRRGAGRARPRPAAVLHRRRRARRPRSPAIRRARAIRCGACRSGAPTTR